MEMDIRGPGTWNTQLIQHQPKPSLESRETLGERNPRRARVIRITKESRMGGINRILKEFISWWSDHNGEKGEKGGKERGERLMMQSFGLLNSFALGECNRLHILFHKENEKDNTRRKGIGSKPGTTYLNKGEVRKMKGEGGLP